MTNVLIIVFTNYSVAGYLGKFNGFFLILDMLCNGFEDVILELFLEDLLRAMKYAKFDKTSTILFKIQELLP